MIEIVQAVHVWKLMEEMMGREQSVYEVFDGVLDDDSDERSCHRARY